MRGFKSLTGSQGGRSSAAERCVANAETVGSIPTARSNFLRHRRVRPRDQHLPAWQVL